MRTTNQPRLKRLSANPSQVLKKVDEKTKSAPNEQTTPASGSYSKKQLAKRQLLAVHPKGAKVAQGAKTKLSTPIVQINTSTANTRTGDLLQLKLDEMLERPLEEESSVARRKSSALEGPPKHSVGTPGVQHMGKGTMGYTRNARKGLLSHQGSKDYSATVGLRGKDENSNYSMILVESAGVPLASRQTKAPKMSLKAPNMATAAGGVRRSKGSSLFASFEKKGNTRTTGSGVYGTIEARRAT